MRRCRFELAGPADDADLRHILYLLLGLHESDPLFLRASRWRARRYVTRLYLACWDDGEPLRKSLDGRPPYLELGCL